MSRRGSLFVGLALCVALLSACGPSAPPAGGRIVVVSTTTPVTALVQVVGRDKIALTALLKSNVDPHEYDPQTDDLRAVAGARVIFKSGVGLDAWLDKLIQNSGTKAPVVDTSNGVIVRKGDSHTPSGDPHIWHSAANAIIMLHNVRDGLAQADPANATAYRANADAYEKVLNDTDAYIKQQIASIPAAQRKLVTNHDTFGYYAERYGLTVVGSIIPSLDTNAQPSARELADLVRQIKAENVKAVFTETSINPALARQIAQEAGVKIVEGGLYGDTLGPPGSGAETIDGMLRKNTDLIVTNLK
ncbi:MAG: zinc ABC transporter substrate-binding protein [Chloroflexi bacterium]|nr:zinc ABC transporter substrate-binding protein [Chloroflexota bacterium]